MNKIALITGGSRGLGKEMALSIAKNGNHVILTYHSQKEKALEVVQTIEEMGQKAVALQLDVSNTGSFGEFISKVTELLKTTFGAKQLHYLINNAGTGLHQDFVTTAEEQFDSMMNIHLKSTFFLSQKILDIMEAGGGIINISSGLTRFAIHGYAAYATMKGAIETLTHYQAKELGARGIRANVVAPGAIATDFGGGAVRDNEQLQGFLASQTALGRVGEANDIGSVVAFLCSDAAKWITAQRIEASGGMFL